MKKIGSALGVLGLSMAIWAISVRAQEVPSQAALDETLKVYCAAWGEPNVDRRRELLGRVWAPEGTYTDRPSHAEGREALVELIGDFLQKFPGILIGVGCSDPEKGLTYGLHSPYFDLDERALDVGVRLFAHLLTSYEAHGPGC